MARRTTAKSAESGGSTFRSTSVPARLFQFGAPFAVSPLLFAALLLLRASVVGVDGQYDSTEVAVLVLYAVLALFIGGGFAIWLWVLSKHRQLAIRVMLTIGAGIGTLGAVLTLALGTLGWWPRIFNTAGTIVAVFWVASRVEALRKDPKGDEEKTTDEGGLEKKLGLDEAVKSYQGATVHRDEHGDVTRIEVTAQHKPGATAKPIQDAVPAFESLAGSVLGNEVPIGRSRAVPDGPAATKITIITKDVLKGMMPYPGPSRPGASGTEPLRIGVHEDQMAEEVCVFGGQPDRDAPNPVSSGRMGVTRSGKTAGAHVEKLELGSRNNVAMLWFDTVKGAQTAEPLADLFALMLATDDVKNIRKATGRLVKLVKARANLLGKHGYPRLDDKASYALGLPYLDIQLEEADDLLKDPQIADDVVFIASKGLSVGMRITVSLQRMDADSAPSKLRFNLNLNFVYGCGDDYSAQFLLTDPTVAAGAHPENWGAKKPGYHYVEGVSIPDERAPVPAKSHFATNEQMRILGAQFAPLMMPLHPVDVATLNGDDGWYDHHLQEMRAQIAEWRALLTPGDGDLVTDGVGHGAPDPVPGPVPAPRPTPDTYMNPAPTRAYAAEADDDEYSDPDGGSVDEEVATVHDDADFPEGAYDGVDPATRRLDPSAPVPPVPAGKGFSWEDPRPPAGDQEAARQALLDVLVGIYNKPSNEADADDDEKIRRDGADLVFGVSAIQERYPFRSRPWFSGQLKAILEGSLLAQYGLELALDDPQVPGVYRLSALPVAATRGG